MADLRPKRKTEYEKAGELIKRHHALIIMIAVIIIYLTLIYAFPDAATNFPGGL